MHPEKIKVKVNEGERLTRKAKRLKKMAADFLLKIKVPENVLRDTPCSIMTFGEKLWLEGVVFVGFTGIKPGKMNEVLGGISIPFSTDQDQEEGVIERTLSFENKISFPEANTASPCEYLRASTTYSTGRTESGSEMMPINSYLATKPRAEEYLIRKGALIVFSNKVLRQLYNLGIQPGQEVGLITKTEPYK